MLSNESTIHAMNYNPISARTYIFTEGINNLLMQVMIIIYYSNRFIGVLFYIHYVQLTYNIKLTRWRTQDFILVVVVV